MEGTAMRYTVLLGRILYSLIFAMTPLGHFSSQYIAYAAQQGVPLASLLVPLSGVIAFAGALSVAFGYHARAGAWLLVVFLVPVTLMMHNFWAVKDPMMAQMQVAMFMKNVSMRSEEHTSELQSPCNLVCRLLLEKKKKHKINQCNTK